MLWASITVQDSPMSHRGAITDATDYVTIIVGILRTSPLIQLDKGIFGQISSTRVPANLHSAPEFKIFKMPRVHCVLHS